MPHRIEPGSDEVWRADDPAFLARMLEESGSASAMCRAVAILGNGKKVKSDVIEINGEKVRRDLTIQLVSRSESDDAQGQVAAPSESTGENSEN
jgi:hypothetical protein